VYAQIQERKNVILLGDTLGDVQMIEWFDYKNLLKIWFLNDEKKTHLKSFTEVYDVVILNDGPLDFVNELLQKIIKNKR
jgi:5'-nucleotidase